MFTIFHLLFDHVHFTLIRGPNIPSSYVILFLQHRTLLSPPDTSITECRFRFDPTTLFFLELLVIALCSSLLAYCIPSNLGGSSSSVIFFCLFILFMGFLQQEYWTGFLPFPPPVDHILSELFIMTHPSWVALHGIAHSFIELCKLLHHYKAVICEGNNGLLLSHKKNEILFVTALEFTSITIHLHN